MSSPQLHIALGVAHHGGPSSGTTGSMQAHNGFTRHGKHKGVPVAQVLLFRKTANGQDL